MEAAPFALKLRMLKTEVMETQLYGCVTWTLGKEHFAELRTAHRRFPLRISDFQRRQRTDHLMSYAKALKKAQRESCLLYTSPSPRDQRGSRMPSSA